MTKYVGKNFALKFQAIVEKLQKIYRGIFILSCLVEYKAN